MPPTSDSPFDKGNDAADTCVCGDEQRRVHLAWTLACEGVTCGTCLACMERAVWSIAALDACWSLFTFAKLHRTVLFFSFRIPELLGRSKPHKRITRRPLPRTRSADGGLEGRVTWRTRSLCELRLCTYFHCAARFPFGGRDRAREERIFMNRVVWEYFHVPGAVARPQTTHVGLLLCVYHDPVLLRPPDGHSLG